MKKTQLPYHMAKNRQMKRKEKGDKVVGWIIFILLILVISAWAWSSFLTG